MLKPKTLVKNEFIPLGREDFMITKLCDLSVNKQREFVFFVNSENTTGIIHF